MKTPRVHMGWWRLGMGVVVAAGTLAWTPGEATGAASGAAVHTVPAAMHPQGEVTVRGHGFGPGRSVAVSVAGIPVGSVVAGPDGKILKQVRVPASALPGAQPVTASQGGRVAVGSVTVRTNWREGGRGPGLRSNNPFENVIGPDQVAAGTRIVWHARPTCECFYKLRGVAVVDGIGYTESAEGWVVAFDLSDGSTLWSTQIAGERVEAATPLVLDGKVFATVGSQLLTLDAVSGVILRDETGPSFSSPIAVDGTVYVGGENLYAIDPATGAHRWEALKGQGLYGPAIVGGVAYVHNNPGLVAAVSILDGTVLWETTLPATLDIPMVVSAGVIVVQSDNGSVYAVDAKDGHQMWVTRTADLTGWAPTGMAADDTTAYVGNDSGGLLSAINLVDGTFRWRQAIGFVSPDSYPTVANGVLYADAYVSGSGGLAALDVTTGRILATNIAPSYSSFVTVVDGIIYVSGADGIFKVQAG